MRCGWLISGAVVALLALAGGRGLAAKAEPHPAGSEHPPATAGHDDKGGEAHPAGGHPPSPPKDPFARALDLTLWTVVVFLLMLFILGRFAWKPLLQALKAREQAIVDAIESARKDREEAARLREQFQQELNRAAEMVRGMMDEARRDAQHVKDQMVNQARNEIQAEKDRLRREIDMARDQALQDIWNRSAELAAAISSKAIRRSLSVEDHRALVDEALAELDGATAELRRQGGGQPA